MEEPGTYHINQKIKSELSPMTGQMDMLPPGAMHGAAQVAGGASLPTLQLLNLITRTQQTNPD